MLIVSAAPKARGGQRESSRRLSGLELRPMPAPWKKYAVAFADLRQRDIRHAEPGCKQSQGFRPNQVIELLAAEMLFHEEFRMSDGAGKALGTSFKEIVQSR